MIVTVRAKVRPVFQHLAELRNEGARFRDIPQKHETIYLPILAAFIQETTAHANTKSMMKYLIGRYDFYKAIKENGSILLQSYNLRKTLQWGKKVPLPKKIISCEMKENSKTTAIMYMDKGWQVSFRLHSARSLAEPSLKFDARFIGAPSELSNHEIPYLDG